MNYSDLSSSRFTSIKTMMANEDPAQIVIQALDNAGISHDVIQLGMLALLDDLAVLQPRDIPQHTGLIQIFEHDMRGTDRGSLVSWLQEFSPIRVKFLANGQFEKLVWSKSVAKARYRDGLEVIDTDCASRVQWYDFNPERTRVVAKGSYLKGLKALARETARAGYENGHPADLDAMMEELKSAMEDHFRSQLIEVVSSDSHEDWIAKREEDKAKEAK